MAGTLAVAADAMSEGRILTVNVGSSSAKLRVLDRQERLIAAVDRAFHDEHDVADVVAAATSLAPADVVIHRVVHGGPLFRSATVVDDDVVTRLRGLAGLASLHQSNALDVVDALRSAIGGRHVACFDTAFHATIAEEVLTYAIPQEWRTTFGIRRYGFHGLSHSYAANRAAEMLARPVDGMRTVVCHLGSGASLCAVNGGFSVDTTMGFTPLEGLVMATRSGSVDPGALLWLADQHGLSASAVRDALEHRSGLLALGGSGDMRTIVAGVEAGDERCALAFGVYAHRLTGYIAAMVAALGGVDALVFTGGVGEHARAVRSAACGRLGFLDIHIVDDADTADRDAAAEGDRSIGDPESAVAVLVVEAREDLAMLRAMLRDVERSGDG